MDNPTLRAADNERASAKFDDLIAALKPFAEIGQRLHEANQSVLIGASARYLRLEPLTGQDFVNAHLAIAKATQCSNLSDGLASEAQPSR